MSDLVEINNVELSVKEFNNLRVVTFKDIDKVHYRPEGTAKRNFTTNKKYLVKDEDYFIIKPSDFKKDEIRTSGIYQVNPRGTTFITETGYLMLVKSFTDDLAWKVQRQLVSSYFKTKETKVQTLDVINHYKDIRDMFTLTLNSILERLHLQNEPEIKSMRNIFDELAAQIDSAKVS